MILCIASKSGSSWSLRPWILMRELRIEFEERVVPFAPGSSYDRFRKFSPTGRLPCLLDGDDVIWDSLAVIEHLADRYPEVWPDDRRARSWARSASAEMHSGFAALRRTCPMDFEASAPITLPDEDLARDVARLDELWTEGLSRFGGPFLTGDQFTAVDAFFTPVAFRFRAYGLRAGSHAMAYVERLLQLDGMKEWNLAAIEELQHSSHDSTVSHPTPLACASTGRPSAWKDLSMSFFGGCRCGACRYVLDFATMPASYACHCLDCQTMTSSAFSLHAVVPLSRFTFNGPLEGWSRINGEGTLTTHHVCGVCKTRIHSTNVGRPGVAIVRMGTLDQSQAIIPVVHMWARRKQAWIGLSVDAEVYQEAISVERLRAVFSLNLDPHRDGPIAK